MPTVAQNLDNLAVKGVFRAVREGMADGMIALLDVATSDAYPATPLDAGGLRGSGTAFVDRDLVKVNPNEFTGVSQRVSLSGPARVPKPPTPAMTHAEPLDKNAITGMVVFNQEYAEDVHEDGPRNWTTPGTGDKFLELKVPDAGTVTIEHIADKLRALIGD